MVNRLNATIHAEYGVSEESIEAAEFGLIAATSPTGLKLGVRAIKLSARELFPTMSNGQVSDSIIAGHPVWAGGGPNLWLTSRDLTHYNGSTNYIHGATGNDGHLVVSTHRLDDGQKLKPLQLFATVTHETGHVYGLVEPDSERHDRKYGFSGHCKNECTMRASNGLRDTEIMTNRLVNNLATAGFCVACLSDLRKFGDNLRNK